MAVPNELKYSKEHEWVKVEGNVATIGITEYAQSELGDIVFVELPETDDEINEGDTFGSVESVKTVSELYARMDKGHQYLLTEHSELHCLFEKFTCFNNNWR